MEINIQKMLQFDDLKPVIALAFNVSIDTVFTYDQQMEISDTNLDTVGLGIIHSPHESYQTFVTCYEFKEFDRNVIETGSLLSSTFGCRVAIARDFYEEGMYGDTYVFTADRRILVGWMDDINSNFSVVDLKVWKD